MAYKGRVTLEAIFSRLSQEMEDAKSAQNGKRLEELEQIVSVLNDIAAQYGDTLTWEGGTLLPSQGRLTIANMLCALCEQIMALKGASNEANLGKLYEIVRFLEDVAVQCKDTLLFDDWLDDMHYSLNYAFLVPFKMGVPSTEKIRATLATADQYHGVQATLIRRNRLRSPKSLRCYEWNNDYESMLETEWVGIARVSGPYTETFDVLPYKFGGTLLSFSPFPPLPYTSAGPLRTFDADRWLAEALAFAGERYSANSLDWELCQIEITDEQGRMPWLPAKQAL
ncbi:MAG TPA: hypothetical protein VF099_08380 [Ktedonobacterales bacterium]